jgi:uncharacterized Zn-finger protein
MKLLLLGEADFSFTRALSYISNECIFQWLGKSSSDRIKIVATSLDSRTEFLGKYHTAIPSSDDSVSINFSVNALDGGKLNDLCSEPDFVIWNHPHLGYEDLHAHHELLCHFFHSMKTVFPKTVVVISLLRNQIERWQVMEAAASQTMNLVRLLPLVESDFPNYVCKRNLTGDSFKSARARDNWESEIDLRSFFLFFDNSASPIPNWRALIGSPEKTETFNCRKCGKAFKSEQGLRTHTRQVHELQLYALKPAVCTVCDKQFDSEQARDMHEKNAHGPNSVTTEPRNKKPRLSSDEYQCAICGSKDASHVEKMGKNRNVEIFTCNICEKDFTSNRALSQHMNVVHSNKDGDGRSS